MKPSFVWQLLISTFIGFFASMLYPWILDRQIGSLGLTIILITVFFAGKVFGELRNWIDGS